MATIVASFLRSLARGAAKVIKRTPGVPQLPPLQQQSCRIFTHKILTHSKLPQKFLWANLHTFVRNHALADIRRKACQDFLRKNSTKLSLLSFVGLYMSKADDNPHEASITDCVKSFQEAFQYSLKENCKETLPTEQKYYEIKARLGKPSSNGVVYTASYNQTEYAMKILFNWAVPSNSLQIRQKFEKEVSMLHAVKDEMKPSKPVINHPNIIKIHQTFVDGFPLLYDAVDSYKTMLPSKYHKEGVGRNKTFFIIMPKHQTSLRDYLTENWKLAFDQKFHLFLQLLNAVAYLETNKIAHRDLKCDNILLDGDGDSHSSYPQLILTDFGDCFCGDTDMLLPYKSYDVSLGGNSALMAPEVISKRPGEEVFIDYSKSDAWAVGTIAYEIFGNSNPFYQLLRNDLYTDDELPYLNSGSCFVDEIVKQLLTKDAKERISASLASTALFLWKYAPHSWTISNTISKNEVECWLLQLCIECRRHFINQQSISECDINIQHSLVFLAMTTINDVMAAMSVIQMLSGYQL